MDVQIVDYSMGNLRSVQKAIQRLGIDCGIASDPDRLSAADVMILPGVGAFEDAINELRRSGLIAPVLDHLRRDRPFLGICLGLQLLVDRSDEGGDHEGLGVIAGRCVRFDVRPDPHRPGSDRKVPHMGWNQVAKRNDADTLVGVRDEDYFYFVHSHHVVADDPDLVSLTCEYGGQTVTAAVSRGRLLATQFHPEKSQAAGRRLLEGFFSSVDQAVASPRAIS